MTPRTAASVFLAGAAWLALFALLFSFGAAVGAWPAPAEGALAGADLFVGLAFAAVLLAFLLAERTAGPLRLR